MTAATKEPEMAAVFEERSSVRVSRQERLLYGEDAPLVRRLGDAAQALDDALHIATAGRSQPDNRPEVVQARQERAKEIVDLGDQARRLFRRSAEQIARDLR